MLKFLCTLAFILFGVLAVSTNHVLAQSGCSNYNTVASCATAPAQSNPMYCVWDDQKGCITDPCIQFSANTTCQATTGCLWFPWNTFVPCFSSYLLCANLGVTNCNKYPFCTVRENTYCGTVGVIGVNTVTVSCDFSFPGWSVALIIVWLIIMVILGFIVLLAMGKSKAQKVTGVEKDEDVVVDSLAIRDNFHLGDPLNQEKETKH